MEPHQLLDGSPLGENEDPLQQLHQVPSVSEELIFYGAQYHPAASLWVHHSGNLAPISCIDDILASARCIFGA